MYEELVRCLRHCVDAPEHRGCGANCKYGKEQPLNYLCIPAMMHEAAETIEELNRENESLAKSVNEASEILRKRWIPVTERLPDYEGRVLCFVTGFTGQKNQEILYFEREPSKNGTFYDMDGIGLAKNRVTHWMPLSEPTKEET